MLETPLATGADGLYHPVDEADVAALVRHAADAGRRLRVRGAGHAPQESIEVGEGDLLVSLDRMRELRVLDEDARLVEAQAGIHLGRDPATAGPAGALHSSLLWQLAERGWTLSSTGGITHQTLGGYLATTSTGGTLQHSMLDQIESVRLVDGRGAIQEFRGWDDPDDARGLAAVLPSLGLLGVITSVTLRAVALFTISGQEAITTIPDAAIDLLGSGDDDRPSLARFLAEAEYARIEWWPQRGAERLLIWQAQRGTPQPGFRPAPYEEFTAYPIIAEAIISTLYVVFGNLGAADRLCFLLHRNARHIAGLLSELEEQGLLTPRLRRLARLTPRLVRAVAGIGPLMCRLGPLTQRALPRIVPAAIDVVLPLDKDKRGMRRGEPQAFRDWSWSGLPMDNQASDVLLSSAFNEMWVPLPLAQRLLKVVRAYFAEPAAAEDAYRRTGLYAYEIYGAPASTGWMHPGHSDGDDVWRDGAVRLDVYWFSDNADDPMDRFFPQFWELLRDHDIPFRLHWGKESPGGSEWTELIRSRYPRWDDFLALRAELDPDDVFVTGWWRHRLGL